MLFRLDCRITIRKAFNATPNIAEYFYCINVIMGSMVRCQLPISKPAELVIKLTISNKRTVCEGDIA